MIDECRFPFHHDKDYIDFHSIIIGPLHFSFTILWLPEITLKCPIIKTQGKFGKLAETSLPYIQHYFISIRE